jgi:hypothetical protein
MMPQENGRLRARAVVTARIDAMSHAFLIEQRTIPERVAHAPARLNLQGSKDNAKSLPCACMLGGGGCNRPI